MKDKKVNLILFCTGALGYGFLEVLWRGYTHWSMLCAGGICFVFFGKVCDKMKKANLFLKAVTCSVFITFIEFIFGVIFNIILKKNVWDYSNLPLNFLGQICIIYSALWGALSLLFLPLAQFIKRKI